MDLDPRFDTITSFYLATTAAITVGGIALVIWLSWLLFSHVRIQEFL